MKFNKIYAFIFALTLFFIGNYSVKAENIIGNIKDSNGNVIPEFNHTATMCFQNYNLKPFVAGCLSSSLVDELGYNFIILETKNENNPYVLMVLSHYSWYKQTDPSTTYYYGGRFFWNENASHHIGYYVNEYGYKVFNFGNHDSNITTSSSYQFLGYYGATSYDSMINDTEYEKYYISKVNLE